MARFSLKLNDYGGATVLAANDAAPGFLTLQTASDGRLAMSMTRGGATAASNPTGGVLSGLIDASAMVAGRRSQLDGLANGFVVSLNGLASGRAQHRRHRRCAPAGGATAPRR